MSMPRGLSSVFAKTVRSALEVYSTSKKAGVNKKWTDCIDDVMAFLRNEYPDYAELLYRAFSLGGNKRAYGDRRCIVTGMCMEYFISESTYYKWEADAVTIVGMEAYRRGLLDIGIGHEN